MRRLLVPLVVVAGLVLTACGSSTPAASPPASAPAHAANPPVVSGATDLKAEPHIGPGTTPPPSSLETKDLVVGTGATATASDTVQVQYVGTNYTDGKPFDSSWSRGQPSSFPLNQVVPGFAQGITGMKIGGRREIVIPPALGYGTGRGPSGTSDETLVFVVDLLAIQ
ncbi:MAG TPA: FKBP-type peptidyl-prolyl cis-trans isomerase [Acidimicrobiales bacterium]